MKNGQAILQFDAAVCKRLGWDEQKRSIPVAAGQTVAQALQTLEIRLPQAGVVLVNPQGASSGVTSDLNHVLRPGDKVRFLFQISGG
jgi:sulfur carrier protein ThiS